MCNRPTPQWIHLPGIRLIEDVGNGMGLRLSWMEAAPADHTKQVHYNIYKGDTKFELLESSPIAITTARQAIINVDPGNLHYFMVRATEFSLTEFNISELSQIGVDLFQYPQSQELLSSIDAYAATIVVADNSEFPEKGYLKIGFEIIKYSSKNNTNQFYVEDTERGAFTTLPEAHVSGETVELFWGAEEQNTIIFEETAAWHQDNGIPRNTDAIGQFNVDDDGYRETAEDIVTTDLSASDANTVDFPTYDYCGYHRPSIQSTFSGQCTGSYVGGEFNGLRGFNFQERNLSQLDMLLQVTGENVILLRRKTSGRKCRCMTLRREQPRFRCQYCFGTHFDGGYDRYINQRAISESYDNVQGFIMVRIHPFSDDLKLEQSQGLTQSAELTAWTINVPTIKDRDIIVRFNEDGTEEFRYEVLDVTRNKLVFGQSGKQEFRMKRMDKTDVLYAFNATI